MCQRTARLSESEQRSLNVLASERNSLPCIMYSSAFSQLCCCVRTLAHFAVTTAWPGHTISIVRTNMLHYICIGQSKELYGMFIFIPSPNMTALSYRRPAFSNISRDSCGAQCNYKSETLRVPIHMPYCWFTNREQGRVGMVSGDAKPYMCETYKAVAMEKLSPFGCHVYAGSQTKTLNVRKKNRDNGVYSCRHSQSSARTGSNYTEQYRQHIN
jgi:hypothetical protein